MDHATIIHKLGGYQVVAGLFGLNPSTVWRWQRYGIPPMHWPVIIQLSRKRRLGVTIDVLLAHARQRKAA